MKVLIVTHHCLCGNGGGVFASRAFVNAIASVTDETYLMYPCLENEGNLKLNSNVKKIPVSYKKNKILKFFDVLLGRVHRYYRVFERHLCSIKPDVVVFDNSRVSYKLIDLAKQYRCKVITIHHNYEYEYNRDNSPWYLKKILLFWTNCYEGEAVRKSDWNLVLTKQDVELLANHYNAGRKESFEIIGAFEYAESDEKSFGSLARSHGNGLNFVITGNLSAMQTERSLISWFDCYYPSLKKVLPKASLTVAGKNPSVKLRQKCIKMGANLIASPESMDEILDQGDVYICPVSLGGGIKLRVMDGLKNGLLVIAHEVSARGYDVFVEQGLLYVYNDKESFEKCLENIQKKVYNKANVVNVYKSLFSFDAGRKRMKKVFDRMV